MRSRARSWVAALAATHLALSGAASGAPVAVDRAVVRFDAAETGGPGRPQFLFERELSFEARLEALADRDQADRSRPYLERHVRTAIERHIAEELLAHLAIDPEPSSVDVRQRIAAARAVLEQRVGGLDALASAARAEGIDANEIERVVQREARASLYLDRMVAPMLEPSEAELREVHRAATNPFSSQRFEEVAVVLRRWYVAERLEAAVGAFYQNARARLHITLLRS